MGAGTYLDVEDLDVYQKLCQLHLEVCDLTHEWPKEERYELGSQARLSSNSSPAQLAEKNDDRHVRNKVEGVNRSRGEAGETIHHLFMALLKKYMTNETFRTYRTRYKECIRMLNGLEKHWRKNSRPVTADGTSAKTLPNTPRTTNFVHPAGPSPKPNTRNPTPETQHLTPET